MEMYLECFILFFTFMHNSDLSRQIIFRLPLVFVFLVTWKFYLNQKWNQLVRIFVRWFASTSDVNYLNSSASINSQWFLAMKYHLNPLLLIYSSQLWSSFAIRRFKEDRSLSIVVPQTIDAACELIKQILQYVMWHTVRFWYVWASLPKTYQTRQHNDKLTQDFTWTFRRVEDLCALDPA